MRRLFYQNGEPHTFRTLKEFQSFLLEKFDFRFKPAHVKFPWTSKSVEADSYYRNLFGTLDRAETKFKQSSINLDKANKEYRQASINQENAIDAQNRATFTLYKNHKQLKQCSRRSDCKMQGEYCSIVRSVLMCSKLQNDLLDMESGINTLK
jgi:hypothetical protein